MPNQPPDTGPADRDPEKLKRRGASQRNPNPNQVKDDTQLGQGQTGPNPAGNNPNPSGSAAQVPPEKPKSRQVLEEWCRGNLGMKPTDDDAFKRAAEDLEATLDNAGYSVSDK